MNPEIRKVFNNTPRDEILYVIFNTKEFTEEHKLVYQGAIKCFWTTGDGLCFQSKFDIKDYWKLNISKVVDIITKEENPEYFL